VADAIPDFTPVSLITGFLGSGKTTLLRRLLADPALADTAVLINEFGEIGLDHQLVERVDGDMVLLQSGCVCCTIRGELADAIKDLHSRRERGLMPAFCRLVIESTGLADPFPILSTVHADPVLRHHFRLGAVTTTLDAVNAPAQLDRQSESVKQLAVADRVVLTKTDIASETEAERSAGLIERYNPTATVIRAADEAIDAGLLIGEAFAIGRKGSHAAAWFDRAIAALGKGRRLAHGHEDAHDRGIASFALVLDRALDWTAFGLWLTMLLHAHGAAILRFKAILNVAGADAPVALHGVQHLVHVPRHLSAWPDEDRRSKLVFITHGIDRALIERSMAAFDVFASDDA
jgi:G3E family GTPase